MAWSVGSAAEGQWWVGTDRDDFGPGCHHPPGQEGHLDEGARRLTHEEYAVASQLASEGHDVRSLRETRGRGRTPDLEVCGGLVEVKSWEPLDERQGRAPTPRSVLNKLISAGGQAPSVVLYAAGRGATAGTVRRGLALYAGKGHAGQRRGAGVDSVRVLGDGFDLSWARVRSKGLDRRTAPVTKAPELGR